MVMFALLDPYPYMDPGTLLNQDPIGPIPFHRV